MNFKLITAAVASVAMMALSACAASTDPQTKATIKRSPSARSSATATPSTPGSPTASSRTGDPVDGKKLATRMAAAMTARKTAHTTLTSGSTQLAEGNIMFSRPPRATLRSSSGGMNIEVIQVGGLTYFKGMPGLTKPWIRFDPNGTGPGAKAISAAVGDLSEGNDPRAALSLIAGVQGRDRGARTMDGVEARLYSFEVSLSSHAKVLDPQMMKKLKEKGVSGPITISYWVGDDNLPRKITTEFKVGGRMASAAVTYRDWGKPVRIVAPPASQVGEIPGG